MCSIFEHAQRILDFLQRPKHFYFTGNKRRVDGQVFLLEISRVYYEKVKKFEEFSHCWNCYSIQHSIKAPISGLFLGRNLQWHHHLSRHRYSCNRVNLQETIGILVSYFLSTRNRRIFSDCRHNGGQGFWDSLNFTLFPHRTWTVAGCSEVETIF